MTIELIPRFAPVLPDQRVLELMNRQLKWLTNTWAVPTSFPNSEVVIRGSAMAAFAIGVTTQTGVWDPALSGVPNYFTATNKAVAAIRGVVGAHITQGGTWGHSWQSNFWAGIVGQAAWLLSNYLTPSDMTDVGTMLASEADWRMTIAPPFMYQPDGTVNTVGDSKAEENAWNTAATSLAACMMPTHAHASQWIANACLYAVSSFTHLDDLSPGGEKFNGIDPAVVCTGYNVEHDYTVINHGYNPNPDYQSTINLLGASALSFGLAGKSAPEALLFNFDKVYAELSNPLPAFGGQAFYIPGQPTPSIYYPVGNDWGNRRPDTYLFADAVASAYAGLDWMSERSAGYWLRVHTFDIWSQQNRYSTGQIYPSGAAGDVEMKYAAREQLAAYNVAAGWLALHLSSQGRTRLSMLDV